VQVRVRPCKSVLVRATTLEMTRDSTDILSQDDLKFQVTEESMTFSREEAGYAIGPHPDHQRLYQVFIKEDALGTFFERLDSVNTQFLTYVAFMRFQVAHELETVLGKAFSETINGILRDRESGGFTLAVPGKFAERERYIQMGTAIAHLIGVPNHDSMSGNYFACFTVRDSDQSDSFLRYAYRPLTLHTDGTFVNELTEFVLMMKMAAQHVEGGRTRLLHLDDWEPLERFADHPLASSEVTYKSPPSKNVAERAVRQTFFKRQGATCITYIDQFAQPRSMELARYLYDLSLAIENAEAVKTVKLPVGGMVVINNWFWLHGREAYKKHPELMRELMRQRGVFRENA